MRAFRGGPLGIGWVPLVAGTAALGLGAYFLFRSRTGGAAPQTVASLPVVQPYPYPSSAGPAPASNLASRQLQSVYSSSPPDFSSNAPTWPSRWVNLTQ